MRFEVNIDKKYFFAFILIGLIFIGIVGVIAYNSAGVPANFGHSVNEIDLGQMINANLSVNGSVNAAGNVSASAVCIGGVCRNSWISGGVTKIINGSGIMISPLSGTGDVIISAISGGSAIPSGMIAMFNTACPTGWTRFTALDNRFPQGAATAGGIGGATSHGHTVSIGTDWAGYGTGQMVGNEGTYYTSTAYNIPPYYNIVFCMKN